MEIAYNKNDFIKVKFLGCDNDNCYLIGEHPRFLGDYVEVFIDKMLDF